MSGFKAKANANAGNRVEQPNIEPGGYPARLVNILDLGRQPQAGFEGKPKPPAQMVRVTYELTDVFMLNEDGEELEDKPRWISEEFPLYSLEADLAKSTKRYKAIDPELEHDGDWSLILGNGCTVGVVNKTSKGKTYDNVGVVSAMRKRDLDKLPELKNPSYFFMLDEPDMEVYNKLPKWIQDKITSNLDYEGSKLQELIGGEPEAKKPVEKKAKAAKVEEPEVDDPPFDADPEEDVNW